MTLMRTRSRALAVARPNSFAPKSTGMEVADREYHVRHSGRVCGHVGDVEAGGYTVAAVTCAYVRGR